MRGLRPRRCKLSRDTRESRREQMLSCPSHRPTCFSTSLRRSVLPVSSPQRCPGPAWRPRSVPILRTVPGAAWPLVCLCPVSREGQVVAAGEAGAFHPRAFLSALPGMARLKLTGLVPGRRVSAWGSSIIHHGGSGARGKKSASKAPAPERGLGTAPQGPAWRRCQKANERPDSCSLLKSARGPL